MSKERGRILSEYRRSNASGIHVSRKSRRDIEEEALEFELHSWKLGGNVGTVSYLPTAPIDLDLDDLEEPSLAELEAIELEDYGDDDRVFDLGSDYWPEPDDEYDDYGDDEYDWDEDS